MINNSFSGLLRLCLMMILSIVSVIVYSQSFEIRIVENDIEYLEVQMRETTGTNTPDQSTKIVDITFTIKWLASLNTDIDIICTNNDYNIIDGLSVKHTSGVYNYRYWNANSTPFNCPDNWVTNEWQSIVTFYTTIGSGTGDFIVSDHLEFARYLNWNQSGVDYSPVPNGSVTYTYPKEFYSRVWAGGASGNEMDWYTADNWVDECGETGAVPTLIDNVLIPDVSALSGFFPEQMTSSGGMNCNDLFVRDNAHLFIPTINGSLQVAGDINNYGELKIMPDADVTVTGSTFIDKAEGLVISSDIAGTGSFLDNGEISYGSFGSVKIETFLENAAAAPGTFYFHQIGPTVNSPYYTGVGTGILLGSFDINVLGTWAYEWQESMGQWNVIYWIFHEIPTTKGFILSTIDQTNHTLSMTGELITGVVESIPMTFGGSNIELICNPYPSAIDFDDIHTLNSSVIESNYQAWDPSGTGNYATYSVESGGTNGATQYIQVGQSVFFETIGFGNLNFNNSQRSHDNAFFFKNGYSNRLTVEVSSTDFSDEVIIHFMDSASVGYDEGFDIAKWTSMIPEAIDIRCVAEDSTELSINVLPISGMETMYSVPLKFSNSDSSFCTLYIDGLETFNNYIEIWLEDLKIGGNWIDMVNNPEYIFDTSPLDSINRFILHFHDPTITGNEDLEEFVDIRIFSSGKEIYILNESNLPILSYSVYSLTGSELMSFKGNSNFMNKVVLSVETGNYIMRVIMEDKVYNEKIFIN